MGASNSGCQGCSTRFGGKPPIVRNETVHAVKRDLEDFSRKAPVHGEQGEIYLIICSLDYKQTDNPLTCTVDGNNVAELAGLCGVRNIEKLYDEEATVSNVRRLVKRVARNCNPDDYFIFYYSGHGTNLKDDDGDEKDGQDEAFCFVDEQGQVSFETCLRDDDFAELITRNVSDETRIIIISDCCHSGTVADLRKSEWEGFQAISISGCTDTQTSGDTGRGGICTHSMLLAIEKLQKAGNAEYSVGELYNQTLKQDKKVFDSAQDITIQHTSSTSFEKMVWPLIPPDPYQAPLNRAKKAKPSSSNGGYGGYGASDGYGSSGGGADGADEGSASDLHKMDAQDLLGLGLSPAMVAFIQEHPPTGIDDDETESELEEEVPNCHKQ